MYADEKYIFAGFFDYNVRILKLTSYWYYDEHTNPRKRRLQLAYNLFWSIYMFFIYLPTEILPAIYAYNNLDKLLRQIRDLGNHTSAIYKTINYLRTRRELLKLLDILRFGDYNYEEYKSFQPKMILAKEKRSALKWTKSFWLFCNAICATMFVSYVVIFFLAGGQPYVEEGGRKIYRQKQPVNTISPFGEGTRAQHFATFIFTIVALTFYAAMIVAQDSLFISFLSCVSSHLLILGGAFRTMRARCMLRLKMNPEKSPTDLHNSIELNIEMDKEMIKCMKHLQRILYVASKLELIYHRQTFVQTLVALAEMCFSLYLLSQGLDENAGNEFTYLIATGFEMFMYCWFGNRLTEASLSLKRALFECDWLATSHKFRKQLVFTMTRMQKPISITIGKITPLTFSTFLTIVRGAYSFFTFLNQKREVKNA